MTTHYMKWDGGWDDYLFDWNLSLQGINQRSKKALISVWSQPNFEDGVSNMAENSCGLKNQFNQTPSESSEQHKYISTITKWNKL